MATGYTIESREGLLPFMARDEIEAVQSASQQLIADNTVGGLASPYLFGRNNNWNQNQFLRGAGGTTLNATAGYRINAGSRLVRVQVGVGVASANPVPVIILLDGAPVATFTLNGLETTVALDVEVPPSPAGSSALTIRSGPYVGARARFPLVSVWSVEP